MSHAFLMGILLILSNLIQLTLTCSSRSTGRARPPTPARLSDENGSYPCPDYERETYCQNGGTCYTLTENTTDYFCTCRDGYCGMTCDDKSTRYGCYSSSSDSSSYTTDSGLAMEEDFGGPADTYPCPIGPAEWLCLNGGTCFTVFENSSEFACYCPEGYCGLRCGEKYTRYGCFSTYLVISASVASAGLIAVCSVVLLIAIYIFYEKKILTYNDDEMKLYLKNDVELRSFSRNLSLGKCRDFEFRHFDKPNQQQQQQQHNSFMEQGKMQRDLPSISYI